MYAIIGLGNIGKEYENTYHNMGFMTIDKLAEKWGASFTKNKYHSMVAETRFANEKVYLLKPTTYMNLSGQAVLDIAKSLKLDTKNILVIYDDIDLEVGVIRYRNNGSAGTHNGMRNIISLLGRTDIPRVRMGIGRDDKRDLADYVLSKIDKSKKEILDSAMVEAVDRIERFLQGER